ncbi:MAG: HAD family hydrolase [Clostridia bacterium]|nr:HAD family hydrolase [Clostridia bacterium]
MNKINADSKVKAVVFDLDHTLFDRYETLKLVCHDFFLKKREWFSKDIDEIDAAKIMIEADGRYIVKGWDRVIDYWRESGLLATTSDGNPVVTKEEIVDYIWNYAFLEYAVKYPFANDVLQELRKAGYKVGLLTNAVDECGIKRQTAKLRMLEMEDKFDEILISGEVGLEKPCREVFDIMTKRMGIPAENTLYVGDNPINDVMGSRGAGYIPVWVRLREEYGEECDCEYSVADVSEIPDLVDKINSGE